MTTKLVNYNSIGELQNFSLELKRFIVKNKLFSNIQGKNYVNVEGWEFAGASMGIFPIVKKVENLSNEKEIKYRAEIELMPINKEQPIGYGVAICSSKEGSKRNADEYVIASMAQTRAIGKAYRNTFAYLMKMAGYEATPAEEAQGIKTEREASNETTQSIYQGYLEMIKKADSKFKIEQIRRKIINAKTNNIIDDKIYIQLESKLKEVENGLK